MKTIPHKLLLLAACLLPGFGGCSSGSQSIQAVPAVAAGRGAVQIKIQWPDAPVGRLIPVASQMIQVVLTDAGGGQVAAATSQRPTSGSTTTVSFQNVVAGTYTEAASAYPTSDTTGVPQASGSQSITVTAGTVNKTADLVMNSTITKVAIGPANATATVGGSAITLTASATNKAGNLVLTAPSNIKWTLNATTTASLTANGASATLLGLAKGTAVVSVKETESGVSSASLSVAITSTGTTPPPKGTNILIADAGSNRILGLDAIPPTSTSVYTDSASGTPFGGVIGVAHDSSGRIYVADYYAKIVRVDDFTGKNRVAYAPTGITVNFVYVDKAGKIYWLDDNGAVNRIDDMTGTNHLTYGANALGSSPTSIAVDSTGRIYTWDGNFQITRIDDMTGKNITHYGTQGGGVGHFNAGGGDGGIAIDSANKIYIADTLNGRIVRIDDMTGANWTEFAPPADAGAAVKPDSVVVDSSTSPSIYFTQTYLGKVFKMTDIKGTGLTKLGALNSGLAPVQFPTALSVK